MSQLPFANRYLCRTEQEQVNTQRGGTGCGLVSKTGLGEFDSLRLCEPRHRGPHTTLKPFRFEGAGTLTTPQRTHETPREHPFPRGSNPVRQHGDRFLPPTRAAEGQPPRTQRAGKQHPSPAHPTSGAGNATGRRVEVNPPALGAGSREFESRRPDEAGTSHRQQGGPDKCGSP